MGAIVTDIVRNDWVRDEEAGMPIYLAGHLEPVPDEIDAVDLPIIGALPPELNGRYLRNGPNPLPGQDPGHLFFGPGMVHGIRLRAGRAEWYRNRWVRTTSLQGASFLRSDWSLDLTAVPANTHVIQHAGRVLALVESGFPYELTPELDTVGPCDFSGRLTTAMTAHPKQDAVTGELEFFGYSAIPPYLTYHRLSAGGELVHSRVVPVPGPTLMHDFAVTENHVIWLDLPLVFDLAALSLGIPYRWDDGYGARLGVMPRRRDGEVRWFDIDPCFVFHVGNAHEDGAGRIVLDAVRYEPADFVDFWTGLGGHDAMAGPARAALRAGVARLHRWVLDPATGVSRDEPLSDRLVEMPTHNDACTGRPHRYLYALSDSRPGAEAAIVKYDVLTGASQAHRLGRDVTPGEPAFVAAADARHEDEGWLLTLVNGRGSAGSELLILDATDLGRPPVAAVQLPRRVPTGFHGSWCPDPAT